jgi:beta-glucosidase
MTDTLRPPATLVPPFVWGVATSSYQIEGAADVDGRGPSIWDTFSAQEGKIDDGSTGARACDHYHRWQEDIALMKWLGVDAYRFSIAWPRVLPTGTGPVNEAGLAFYDRLVDALLEAGITPYVTLYHWDLPQALEDKGGWRTRVTSLAFADYTKVVATRLGDRVQQWSTINEPWCAAMLGYELGAHAPGGTDKAEGLLAAHHMLLGHGLATNVLHAECASAQVGLVQMYVDCVPASPSDADAEAAAALDGYFNRWFLDPIYGRGYPADVVSQLVEDGVFDDEALPFVTVGDLETIATPTDFLGVNYYSRNIVRSDKVAEEDNAAPTVHQAPPEALTDMAWEVYPEGLGRALRRVHRDYAPRRMVVTENGAAFDTGPDASGRIPDRRRIAFLEGHIAAVADAREKGVPVDGYFAWSLLDNFEWAFGYEKRFGLVHVDFETLERTPKDSAHWYRAHIQQTRSMHPASGTPRAEGGGS